MKKKLVTYGLIFFAVLSVYSQEDLIVSHSRFMQKVNPSAFGMNNINKTGVLFNSLGLVGSTKIESKYFFGALSFDRDNFSLGLDVYSLTMDNVGMSFTKPSLSYIYKVQLENELYFLPAVTLGFGSNQLDNSKLIFEDQLSLVSGYLQTESQDPLSQLNRSSSYLDLGASFIIHSSNFLVGAGLKHLNQPNISFSQEDIQVKMPLRYSIQAGYEFDVNPYDRSILPRYSTILSFFSASMMGQNIDVYLSQEAQLGQFSIGLNQQFKKTQNIAFTNIGMSVALAYENFEFGALYNFPFQNPLKTSVYSPSTIEVFINFDFSPYLRNKRGDYRRISIDNYY